jgi:hypothetical protein
MHPVGARLAARGIGLEGGSMSDQPLAPAAVLVHHRVADFDSWKVGFDDHEGTRRAAGIVAHHINRAKDDPNDLNIFLAASDLDAAKEFATSADLKETMEKLGVVSAPELIWLKPLREEAIWDRSLPAFVLMHHVADVATWLDGYDAADELRAAHGIIGHAANQSLDDPSLMLVYHQAESFDDLRGFLDSAELKEVMAGAGVTSEPEVSFHTGGFGKAY